MVPWLLGHLDTGLPIGSDPVAVRSCSGLLLSEVGDAGDAANNEYLRRGVRRLKHTLFHGTYVFVCQGLTLIVPDKKGPSLVTFVYESSSMSALLLPMRQSS